MNRSGCVPAAPRVGLAHAVAHQHTDCWLDQGRLIGRSECRLARARLATLCINSHSGQYTWVGEQLVDSKEGVMADIEAWIGSHVR